MSRSDKRLEKLAEGATAPEKPTVAPLHCPACDAPVPMGVEDTATCVACGAKVPLPADVRALRDADRQGQADRAQAEKLYRKLGKPPSKLLEAWVNVFVLGVGAVVGVASLLIALGSVFIIIVALGLELILHGLAGPFGVDLIDRYGGGTVYAMFALGVVVFGAIPMWLVNYLQSSGELRLQLQANLAARPPTRAGFPSTCRMCGAALDVGAGTLGVRCPYCGSDNLVALPKEWIERAGTRQESFHGSIVDAAAKASTLRSEARAILLAIVIIGAVVVLLMGLLGRVAQWLDEDEVPTTYAASMGPPRIMFRTSDSTTLAENIQGDAYRSDYIALHHREVLQLELTAACPALTVFNTTSFPFLRREDHVRWGIAGDGTRIARYKAPYTGLFELDLAGGGTMRWRIARGPAPKLAPLTGCD